MTTILPTIISKIKGQGSLIKKQPAMLRNFVLQPTIRRSTGSGKPEKLFLSGTTIKGRRFKSLSPAACLGRCVLPSAFQVSFEF